MITVITSSNRDRFEPTLRAMHEDRKRVFVDRLGWRLPVLEGDLEVDQFDTDGAVYLVAIEPTTGAHLGSVRLLPTDRPHILGSIFPQLCDGEVPTGPDVYELTRFCISPSVTDQTVGRQVRSELGLAMVEFALLFGIGRVTGTAHMAWLSQLLAVGWDVQPLGLPQEYEGEVIGAIVINITPATLQLLRSRSTRSAPVLRLDLEPLQIAA